MLYVGDVDGDGRADVIHSTGRKFNYGTGCDRVEIGGNIFKEDAEDFFFSRASILCLEGMRRYTVIRPTLLPADRYPVTPSAAARQTRSLHARRSASGIGRCCGQAASQAPQLTHLSAPAPVSLIRFRPQSSAGSVQ